MANSKSKKDSSNIVDGTELTSNGTSLVNSLAAPLQEILDKVEAEIAEVETRIEEFQPTFAELETLQRKRKEVSGMIAKLTGEATPVVRAERGYNLATISDLLSDGKLRTLSEIQKATQINAGSVRAVLVQNPALFHKNETKHWSLVSKTSRKAA